MKKLIAINAIILITITLLIILLAKQHAASYALGGLLAEINLILISLTWYWILNKKLVALSTLIIVFKYAIFGVVIYKILKLDWVEPSWFIFGFSGLIASLIVFVFIQNSSEKQELS